MPARTKTEREADRLANWHAWLLLRAMARDIRVRVIGHGRGLLAEGQVTQNCGTDPTVGCAVFVVDGKRIPVTTIASVQRGG